MADAAVVTSKADSGAGSLRDVVANAAANDTITFAAAVSGNVVLTSGQIVINKALTISGPGADVLTISGNGASRIFNIDDGNLLTDSPVTISGLTLADGYVGSCNNAAPVVASGGAIQSLESLTLTGVVVRHSFASSNGGGLSFGNSKAGQTVTITGSEFLNNVAGCPAATANASAGGINLSIATAADPSANATILIQDTKVQGNVAGRHGGGLRLLAAGPVTLRNVRIRENFAAGLAGGVYVTYSSTPLLNALPTLLIDASEISGNNNGNTSGIGGGGMTVFNDCACAQTAGSGSTVTVRNSTISSNHARNGPGGGISLYGNVALIVQNSTIAYNGAGQAAAAPSLAGGVYRIIGVQSGTSTPNTEGMVSITSSIIANNRGTVGMEDLGQNPAETFANAFVLNQSLVRYSGAITPAPSGSGSIFAQDPLLLPFGDYGGPTQTHALAAGSPAIDSGSNPAAAPNDQRGFARTVGGTTDMGAFEAGNVIPLGCLDADGNGTIGALDGLLILRATLGFTGTRVTDNATGQGATRGTWAAIQAYLNGKCGSSFSP